MSGRVLRMTRVVGGCFSKSARVEDGLFSLRKEVNLAWRAAGFGTQVPVQLGDGERVRSASDGMVPGPGEPTDLSSNVFSRPGTIVKKISICMSMGVNR